MEIKLCGVGGQGMGFAGRLLGEAAITAGFHVVQTTAYGVESRGGASTADILISEGEISFPEVRRPDVILIMAAKGLKSNLRGVNEDTLIFYDPGTVNEEIECPGVKKPFPFTNISLKEFGNGNSATVIGLGALVQATGMLKIETVEKAVRQCLPPRVHEQNLKALKVGQKLIEK